MDWYSLEKKADETQQLRFAVSELFDGLTVIASHHQKYTENEKLKYGIQYDAVSFHAARLHDTNEIRALIIFERVYDDCITYRPYTENDCPGDSNCPKFILEKLSPTRNDNARTWRNRAYQMLDNFINEGSSKQQEIKPKRSPGIKM